MTEGVAEILRQHGKRLVAHAIVSGGSELGHTVRGLDAMATQFPPNVALIAWLNEYPRADRFPPTSALRRRRSTRNTRPASLASCGWQSSIPQPTARIAAMIARGQTFAEAREDSSLFIQTRQRLVEVQRPIWAQLAATL